MKSTVAALGVVLFARAAMAEKPSDWVAILTHRAETVRPTEQESRWQQIPWMRSVIEAQQVARAERRPIMYWHVDDDPLERC